MDHPVPAEPAERERAINAPAVIVILTAALVLVHLVRVMLNPDRDLDVLLTFAFIPARYAPAALEGYVLPGGPGADAWTFITYAFLHGDWVHLGVNAIWMLAFGSAVAWRFGTARFLLFSCLAAVGGALIHLAAHWGEVAPVIGASAAISGHMGAAIRFMFQPGAPLGLFRVRGTASFRVPALSLRDVVRDSRVVMFVGVWFALNLLTGIGGNILSEGAGTVAWEAHIGGFIVGLLLFPLFDPRRYRQ